MAVVQFAPQAPSQEHAPSGRIQSHVETKVLRNDAACPAAFAWTRPCDQLTLDRLSRAASAYEAEFAGQASVLRRRWTNLPTMIGLREGDFPATQAIYERLLPIAKSVKPDFLVLGANGIDETATRQQALVRNLRHNRALPNGTKIVPGLDMRSSDFGRELGKLAATERRIAIRFEPWSSPDFVGNAQVIQQAKRTFGGLKIIAMQVPYRGPNDVQGTVLANALGVDLCMATVHRSGGGSNNPLTQADSWGWANWDGLLYSRWEDGALPHPVVSWVDEEELDLTSDAEVDQQTEMLSVRRQHDFAIGSQLGAAVCVARRNGALGTHLQQALPKFLERLKPELQGLLLAPIQRQARLAP